MTKYFVFLMVLLAVCTQQGCAKLKCYQCTSMSRRDSCYDPRSSGLKAEKCSDDVVTKFVDLLKIANKGLGNELVTRRECAMVNRNELLTLDKCRGIISQAIGGKIEYCGVCDRDGCNVGGKIVAHVLVLAAALWALLLV
ncbi:hypothetical protein B566_EDAN013091 [Ephemera danica]|nr:hypothetical protein B566_EDAN013091 [Ephemera danica]